MWHVFFLFSIKISHVICRIISTYVLCDMFNYLHMSLIFVSFNMVGGHIQLADMTSLHE